MQQFALMCFPCRCGNIGHVFLLECLVHVPFTRYTDVNHDNESVNKKNCYALLVCNITGLQIRYVLSQHSIPLLGEDLFIFLQHAKPVCRTL